GGGGGGGVAGGRPRAPATRSAGGGAPRGRAGAGRWAALRALRARSPSSAHPFLQGGRPPQPGERWRLPELAASLRLVARGGREAYYRGEIAARIASYSREHRGALDEADFADYACEGYQPIATSYRGHTL